MAGELYIRKDLETIDLPLERINYVPGYITLETSDRTIDGTYVSDTIAIKRKFSISWPILDGEFMAGFIDLYLVKEPVEFGEMGADSVVTWYDCILNISDEFLREVHAGNFAFSGFSMELSEI
jgi:hypothetical protein